MGLPGETVDPSGVITTIQNEHPEVIDFLLSDDGRPSAVSLLEQVSAGVPVYMIIPLLLVIGLAITGFNTFCCIGSGLVSAYILGLFAGTAGGIQDFLDNIIYAQFESAGGWVIIMMMWVAAFGGVMQKMDAFAPLAAFVVKMSHKVRGLMTWNAVLSLIGNACLADEMAQIVTMGPVIKQIAEENIETDSEEAMYKIKLRNATFGDAMGVFGSQLIPWHVYLGFYVGIAAGVYPVVQITNMDFLKYNFMAYIAVISLIVLTFTGLDRFIPLFQMPQEPVVRLKKSAAK